MPFTRPGRALMTATRSARYTASLIWCVMKSTVLRASLQILSNSACMNSRVCASSAANGSSISSTTGSAASALRQIHSLLHATGQLRRIVPLEAVQSHQLDELLGPAPHDVAIEAALHLHAVAHVAGDGPPWQQARLLKDDGPIDARARRRVFPSMTTLPGVVAEQAGDDVEECRLAAAARPDDRHELAVGDRERHVRERQHLTAVALDVVALGQAVDVELVHPVSRALFAERELGLALLLGLDAGAEDLLEEAFLHELSTTLLSTILWKSKALRSAAIRGSACCADVALTAPAITYGTRSKMLPFVYRS